VSACDVAAVDAAVRAGDAARVRDLLQGATEKERRDLLKALPPLLRRPPEPDASERERVNWRMLSDNVGFVAVLAGCASGRPAVMRALEGAPYHWQLTPGDYDAFAGVLADRKPPWLGDLIDRMLTQSHELGVESWPLARRLVRLSAIDRPDAEEYGVKMVRALAQAPPPFRRGETPTPQETAKAFGTGGDQLATVLLRDPGLLEDEVWRLFTLPGAGKELERDVYYGFLPLGLQWADALAQVASQGRLDRGRLLSACLDAFLRDFPPNHVAWYATLHDRLQPSAAEKAERSSRYLALLAAAGKPGVVVGQRGCAELLAAGLLDATAFLCASLPALVYPQKSVAAAQLKIIGRLAVVQPDIREAALATAAQAFSHQRDDVQAAAVQLIAKHGVPAGAAERATITRLAAFLSPVLQPEARALGLVPDRVPDAATLGLQVAAVPVDADVAGVRPVNPVVPVTDPAELVQLLTQLMEDAGDALAVERALDGAVRLSALPLRDRAKLAEPLLKRARQQITADFFGPFSGYEPRADIASLALTWATGRMPPTSMGGHGLVGNKWRHGATPKTMSGIPCARSWEACALIADGHGYQLLATPEYDDGSISHDELLARLAQRPAGQAHPPRCDLELAMLRLAPGAEHVLPGDLLAAYAPAQAPLLIEPCVVPPKVTEHTRPDLPGLPGGTWQKVEGHPGAYGRYAGADQAIAPELSRCGYLVTYLEPALHFGRKDAFINVSRISELVAAWPLLAPHQPELIAAHLLRALSEGLIPGRSAASTAAHALTGIGGNFGPVGHLALIAGLASAEADTRIAAADAWTQLTQQRRLDPGLAAKAITLGVSGTAFKLTRIADGLRHTAQDPDAAGTVARACVSAAATLLSAPVRPTALHLLLETAAQAAAISGIPQLPAPLTDLAHEKGHTKLAQAARRLEALR
jgi:hypothetical protein